MFSFNLVNESWIPCRTHANEGSAPELLSLSATFARAREIIEIVGDTPLVTIALHRFLLAVLHRSLGALDPEAWKQVWETKAWNNERIAEYLNEQSPRLDLFDEKYPFYQSGNARPSKEDGDPIQKLFFQSDKTAEWFGHMMGREPSVLTPAQAARLLIAFQTFDVAGLQSSEADNSRKKNKETSTAAQAEKGKEDRSATAAPLNGCAVALARGHNLFETLMLNMYWNDISFFTAFSDRAKDKPAWEREATEPIARHPEGYLDLLTWQSRRIRLQPSLNTHSEMVVTQVVIIKGHRFPDGFERKGREPMVAFKSSRNAKSKTGFLPVTFEEGKALWRDSHILFHHVKDKGEKPLMLDWLNQLRSEGVFSQDSVIPMDYFGFAVQPRQVAKPSFWRHERLPLPLHYLHDEELNAEMQTALGTVEQVARVLQGGVHRLAALMFLIDAHLTNPDWFTQRVGKERRERALERQKQLEKKSKRDGDIGKLISSCEVEPRYWPRLEADFRRLLVELARDAQSWQRQREVWWTTVRRIARQVFAEVASSIGVSTRSLRARALAEAWFDGEMRRVESLYLDPARQADAIDALPDESAGNDFGNDDDETKGSE